jgi:hypothetical protein
MCLFWALLGLLHIVRDFVIFEKERKKESNSCRLLCVYRDEGEKAWKEGEMVLRASQAKALHISICFVEVLIQLSLTLLCDSTSSNRESILVYIYIWW